MTIPKHPDVRHEHGGGANGPPNKNTVAPAEEVKAREVQVGPVTFVLKVDLLAAIGAILGAFASMYSLWNYFSGRPSVEAYAPDYVYIFYLPSAYDGQLIVQFAGQLTFINSGQPGRDGIVNRAWVDVTVPEQAKIREYWFSFLKTPTIEKTPTDTKNLQLNPDSSIYPTLVPGGGAFSKMTMFQPRFEPYEKEHPTYKQDRDYVPASTFYASLKSHRGQFLTVAFQATTVSGNDALPSHCRIGIDDNLLHALSPPTLDDTSLRSFLARCHPDSDFPSPSSAPE